MPGIIAAENEYMVTLPLKQYSLAVEAYIKLHLKYIRIVRTMYWWNADSQFTSELSIFGLLSLLRINSIVVHLYID